MAYEKVETLRQQVAPVAHKQRILARLRLAVTRLTDAQLERTWAIVSAHEQGLTIRQIASTTGLSAARIHQLLTTPYARDIPQWLTYLREGDGSPDPPHSSDSGEVAQQPHEASVTQVTQLSAEVAALRQCIGWLEQLEQGKPVIVNLRLETDPQTEYVAFDGERIRRIL